MERWREYEGQVDKKGRGGRERGAGALDKRGKG